jgi:hypothetical protein
MHFLILAIRVSWGATNPTGIRRSEFDETFVDVHADMPPRFGPETKHTVSGSQLGEVVWLGIVRKGAHMRVVPYNNINVPMNRPVLIFSKELNSPLIITISDPNFKDIVTTTFYFR